MKLLSFMRNGTQSYGAKLGDGVIDLGLRFGARWPTLGTALKGQGLKAMENAAAAGADFGIDEVQLLPTITDPDKIICIGLNYKTHIAEMGREPPKYPTLFSRYPNTLVGSGEKLIRPKVSVQFDYEGEFAIIIGKTARHVKAADAYNYVAGYSCFNDGSIRDWQYHTTHFASGKNFWRSGSMGPWMVTRDELPKEGDAILQTRLNGEVMQHTAISDLLFDTPYLIEYLSAIFQLEPGDVIATGTTGGVGARRNPQVWMKPGDQVEVDIAGIGILRNGIEDEA